MKISYVIVYASLRASIQEKLSVALLMQSDQQVLFRFAEHKLEVLKQLLPPGAFQLLRGYLTGMDRMMNPVRYLHHQQLEMEFNPELLKNFDSGYLEYLAARCQHLITFSQPVQLDTEASQELFNQLFARYVSEENEQDWNVHAPKPPGFIDRVREKLYPRIIQHANLDVALTMRDLPFLILPVEVNFLGRGTVPVAGKIINFEKRAYNLNNDIAGFINLIKSFEAADIRNGKFFIIGNEPSEDIDSRHQTWRQLCQSRFIEVVPADELHRVINYLRLNRVKPYL